jgi:hypothetical protein
MSKPAHRRSILGLFAAASLVLLAPLGAVAGTTSTVPLNAVIFDSIADEEMGNGCPSPESLHDATGFSSDNLSDVIGMTAYDFGLGSPWTPVLNLTGGAYNNGTFIASPGSFLRVQFDTSNKNFTIDTRNSAPLRKFSLDFSKPYSPASNVPSFGTSLTVAALFQVQGLSSITAMGVCSSNSCPESRVLQANLWWDDPKDSSVQWRVHWAGVRVLRMSNQTWYFLADTCGGNWLGGLSQLIGNRTKPREVNSGTFYLPLFIKATLAP